MIQPGEFEDLLKGFETAINPQCPVAKRCETKRELGDWFAQFSRAARAVLPRKAAA